MKYFKDGFRPLYHNFCIFPLNDTIEQACRYYPDVEDAYGVITYGYCDASGELMLFVLSCVKDKGEGAKQLCDIPKDQGCALLIEAVERIEFEFMGYGDDESLMNIFGKRLESVGLLDVDEIKEEVRNCRDIDEFRDKHVIDNVIVTIGKQGLEMEEMWAEAYSITNNRVNARLLDEPYQDYGFHKYDSVSLGIVKDSQGKRRLYANLTGLEPVVEDDADDDLSIDDDVEFDWEDGESLDFVENVYLGVISKEGILKVCSEPCDDMYLDADDPLESSLFKCFNPIFEFDLGEPLDEKYYDRIYSDQGMLVGIDTDERAIYPYRKLESGIDGDPYIVMCDRTEVFELFDGKYINKDKKIKKNLQYKINDFCYFLEAMYLDAMPGYTLEEPIDDLNFDDNFFDELKKNYRNAKDEAFSIFEEFYKNQKVCKYSESNGIIIL